MRDFLISSLETKPKNVFVTMKTFLKYHVFLIVGDQAWNFVLSLELSRWTLLRNVSLILYENLACFLAESFLVLLCSLFSLSFRRIGSYLVCCDPPQVSRATALILIYVFVQILSVFKLYWSKRTTENAKLCSLSLKRWGTF